MLYFFPFSTFVFVFTKLQSCGALSHNNILWFFVGNMEETFTTYMTTGTDYTGTVSTNME